MEKYSFQGTMEKTSRILYTPSAFARANLIHLQEIGQLQATYPHTSRREGLVSYLFFIVESGTGSLVYNGTTYNLQAGDCVFIDCRRKYSHSTGKDLWHLKWAHFNGPNMNGIYEKYLERGGTPVFHPQSPSDYLSKLSDLQAIASSASYVRDMHICEKLTGLLALLMEDGWHQDIEKGCNVKRHNLQEIKDYLDSHYTEDIPLEALSEKFYINKYYLTRIFKDQYGTTINGYKQQLRITHAKQLLRFTDRSLEDIGSECGFPDPNYFSRIFKKVEGIAPGEFRKRW